MTRLARRPHVVYQSEGSSPFVMSHCILSHSSMGYALEGSFAKPDIRIASVLANNLVFYERSSGRTVLQIQNRSTDGAMSIPTLPTVMMSLRTWKRLFPESQVWYRPREWRDTFYLKLLARATILDQSSPDLVYPLERPADPRLPLKAYVNGVQLGGATKAYPLDVFEGEPWCRMSWAASRSRSSRPPTPILCSSTRGVSASAR